MLRAASEVAARFMAPNAPLLSTREDIAGQRPDLMAKSILQNRASVHALGMSLNPMFQNKKLDAESATRINDLHGLMLYV
jgi:hypothetical protein